ncbi:MAG: adenylate kinase [Kiritimatiellae bacterium]|nr:adenylate kinase [Kiritimatiellia bacterium]
MKIVIFLGAPGSGKGTIASRLSESDEKLRHVSSGDLLRDAVKRQTTAGVEAEGYMKRGELVPDAIIGQMIGDYVSGIKGECTVLLDGFPRTVAQAEILDGVAGHCGAELTAVVLLEVSDEIIVERIAGRRGCPKCGAGYHIRNIPSRVEGICDVCGTGLVVRKDDNPETVKNRLSVYKEQTVPLIEFYGSRGLVRRIDGAGRIDDIVRMTRQALS